MLMSATVLGRTTYHWTGHGSVLCSCTSLGLRGKIWPLRHKLLGYRRGLITNLDHLLTILGFSASVPWPHGWNARVLH